MAGSQSWPAAVGASLGAQRPPPLPRPLHMGLAERSLGFFTAWWLGSQREPTKGRQRYRRFYDLAAAGSFLLYCQR